MTASDKSRSDSDSVRTPAEHYAETIARDEYEGGIDPAIAATMPPAEGHQAHATLIAELKAWRDYLVEQGENSRIAWKLRGSSDDYPPTPYRQQFVDEIDSGSALLDRALAALASGGAPQEPDWLEFAQGLSIEAASQMWGHLSNRLASGGAHPHEQDSHIYCDGCGEVQPLERAYMPADANNATAATDLLCGVCHLIVATIHHRASGGPATPPEHGWQPIDTAPKDGQPVLLWWQHWCAWPLVGHYHLGWHSEFASSNEGNQPTHWLPLPAPPVAKDSAAPPRKNSPRTHRRGLAASSAIVVSRRQQSLLGDLT